MKSPSIILVVLFLSLVARGADISVIRMPLTNDGVDADASGYVGSVLRPSASVFGVAVGRLAPRKSYTLKIGDVATELFVTDGAGAATVVFRSPAALGQKELTFDPRGELLQVVDGTAVLLHGLVSATGEPARTSVDERATLGRASAAAGQGTGAIRFYQTATGVRTFTLSLSKVPFGNVKIFTDGIERGALALTNGAAIATFSSVPRRPTERLMAFDPRGTLVEIFAGDGLLLSGRLEAKARGANYALRAAIEIPIANAGVVPGATATATVRLRDDARRAFGVELEGVPAGIYELLVGGTVRGAIDVAESGGETRGAVLFTNAPDEDGVRLTFNPVGQVVALRRGTTTYFSSTLVLPAAAAILPREPGTVTESLASTGLDADASAEATFTVAPDRSRRFEIKLRDVNAGVYSVHVGGLLRRTLRTKIVSGIAEPAFTFATRRLAGDATLPFDPVGQLIEVHGPEGVLFSHLFGDGSAVVPKELTIPLFVTALGVGARAELKYRIHPDGESSLLVEAQNLAAGDYDLTFDGIKRATLSMLAATGGGTAGRVQFRSTPAPGEWPLDFPITGGQVAVMLLSDPPPVAPSPEEGAQMAAAAFAAVTKPPPPLPSANNTIYVDAQLGSDVRDGLSRGAALKTVAAAAQRVGAEGTIVLTGVFRNQFLSLASFRNLKIRGEGVADMILGEEVAAFTPFSGKVWQAPVTTVPNFDSDGGNWIFEWGTPEGPTDGQLMARHNGAAYVLSHARLHRATGIADVGSGNGRWFISGGILYLSAMDGGDPNGRKYYIPSETHSLIEGGTTLMENLEISGVRVFFGRFGFDLGQVKNYRLDRCTAYGSAGPGLFALDNVTGVDVDCNYYANRNDGVAWNSYGTLKSTYTCINPHSAYNGDEGLSPHGGLCYLTIQRGLSEHNRSSAVGCAAGSKTLCDMVVSQRNNSSGEEPHPLGGFVPGVGFAGATGGGTIMVCKSCIALNEWFGFHAAAASMDVRSSLSKNCRAAFAAGLGQTITIRNCVNEGSQFEFSGGGTFIRDPGAPTAFFSRTIPLIP